MPWYIHKPTKQDWHGDPAECPWPVAECLTWPKLEKPPAEVRAVPPHYRVIEGDNVRVATPAERAGIDAQIAAEQAAEQAAARNAALDQAAAICGTIDTSTDPMGLLLLAIVEELVDEIRALKLNNPKPSRTLPELAAATAARLKRNKSA